MKHFILSLSLLLIGITVVYADSDRPISKEQLPAKAQQFLQCYFSDIEVTLAREGGSVVRREYDVTLGDGTTIEFASDGRWIDIESPRALPRDFMPPGIVTYLARHYPSSEVYRIEHSRREWEVQLSNGVELTFDRRYRIVDIDD